MPLCNLFTDHFLEVERGKIFRQKTKHLLIGVQKNTLNEKTWFKAGRAFSDEYKFMVYIYIEKLTYIIYSLKTKHLFNLFLLHLHICKTSISFYNVSFRGAAIFWRHVAIHLKLPAWGVSLATRHRKEEMCKVIFAWLRGIIGLFTSSFEYGNVSSTCQPRLHTHKFSAELQ